MKNFASDENFPAPMVSKPLSKGARDRADGAQPKVIPAGLGPELAPEARMESGLSNEGEEARIESGNTSEEDLIRACQRGDLDAFDRLILLYQDQVFGVAYHLLHDHEEAEDVAQEVFLSCYRNINAFRFESRFSTWIYRVTVNRVKNRWKYNQRRQSDKHVSLDAPLAEDDDRTMEIADTRSDPRQAAEGREILGLVQAAWKTLPLEYQEVLTLRFVQNLQYEEISEALQCSLGTVKSRINRARAQLREKLGSVISE